MPLVSIVVPTYNRARLVREAIASVLGQTHRDIELIVVDDGSSDNTRGAIGDLLDDARVRYVYHENQGLAAARNRGVAMATGTMLGFLDSDDTYPANAIEMHLAVFAKRPEIGMTVGGYAYVDEGGISLGRRCPWEEGGSLDLKGWLFNCYTMPGSILVKRSWFEAAGGFDTGLRVLEDWDWFLRLAQRRCPMAWVRESVCRYRLHAGTMSSQWEAQRDTAMAILDRLFASPTTPPDVLALEPRARGWVSIGFAKKHFDSGQVAPAVQGLRDALAHDPSLAGGRRVLLLEALMAPTRPGAEIDADAADVVLGNLPPEFGVLPGDVRKARARREMTHFFREIERDRFSAAVRHLRAAVSWDSRWAVDRSVWALCVRSAWRVSRGRLRQ